MCVDVTDNELAYLESVHLFVEILDHYFSNVCELDLVFNFHKVSPEPAGRLKHKCLNTVHAAPNSKIHHVRSAHQTSLFLCGYLKVASPRCRTSNCKWYAGVLVAG